MSLEYTSKARTFWEPAPIYEHEVGTSAEADKAGKTKFEVATGKKFLGVKYPLGALVYYKCKSEGVAEPTTKPGIFAGWKLEPGLDYRDCVHILDYEALRERSHKHGEVKTLHQKEVFFPDFEHIEFPFQRAAQCAIRDVSDPEHEVRRAEYDKSLTRGVLPYEISIDSVPQESKCPKLRNASITPLRLLEINPTPGCKGCEEGTSRHSPECRERFNAYYRDKTDAKPGMWHDAPAPGGAASSSRDTHPKSTVACAVLQGMITECENKYSSHHIDAECIDELRHGMVTRLLDRAETLSNPKALEAIRKEAKGLLSKGTWDLRTVMEKSELIKAAKRAGNRLHIGSLMTICSEKYAEMEQALRVLKGRVVYRGDCARDQDGRAALYQNLTASPTSIAAANANIAYGRVPGHKTSSADAVKAYVQALLKAKQPTWVQIPKELWEDDWHQRFKQPVCLLVKALYGHPESGSHWERHLTEIIKEMGGEAVPEHPSSFFIPASGLLLTVYVDDFLLSGPEGQHEAFWAELSKKVEVEDIGGLGRFLGRYHDTFTDEDGQEGVVFGMEEYVKSACEMYEGISGSKKLKPAATPFVPEGSLLTEDDNARGELADEACKVLMKCLWVARLARPDLLKPVIALARNVSCWSRNCDKGLYRLMCYMSSSAHYRMIGVVDDNPEDLHLRLYVDADFAGEREDAYSTSGGWLVLCGPRTYFPLTWVSKKQSSVSRSTTEAEVVALSYSLFKEALPMCQLWDKLLGRVVDLYIMEDNQAAIKICETGYSSKLRHIGRTHKVNIASIRDEVVKEHTHLTGVDTNKQAADIFTKALDPIKWPAALRMLGIRTD